MDNTLKHIGVAKRSGRYPWGSGERPFQRYEDRKKAREEKKRIKAEEKKKKALENENFKYLLKNVDDLSNDEMRDWATRLENRSKILKNIPKEKSVVDVVEKGLQRTSTMAQYIASLGSSIDKIKNLVYNYIED